MDAILIIAILAAISSVAAGAFVLTILLYHILF